MSPAQSTQKIKPVVLIVEDDPLILTLVSECLEVSGFCSIGASCAESAIAILETRSDVRVIFTDIDIPGEMDGIKLAYLARERWPSILILVASGRSLLKKFDLPEGVPVFSKPYSSDDISRTILNLLAANQNASSAPYADIGLIL